MKKLLILALSLCTTATNAQSYLISFAGSGASGTVTYVRVENLRTGTAIQINGNDILRLNTTTGIADRTLAAQDNMKLYPNPMTESTNLEICPPAEGDAVISVVDMTGRVIVQKNLYLENRKQLIHLSGIKQGINLLSVEGPNYRLSDLLISSATAPEKPAIEKKEAIMAESKVKPGSVPSKGIQATVDMEYSAGDWLKFTGAYKTTGTTYETVLTDRPASDKTITFFFVGCIDGDGNRYPVIQMGNYLWMAENLKTTKLNDGTPIPAVTENLDWKNLVTPGYCWYNNNINYKNNNGALYNSYAVATGKLCPIGWHTGSDGDWTTLITDMGGAATAGNKLKDSGTDYWFSTTSLVTNESGFTVLPAGNRYMDEPDGGIGFAQLTFVSIFWTGTYPYSYTFYTDKPEVFRGGFGNRYSGFSVRCVKD